MSGLDLTNLAEGEEKQRLLQYLHDVGALLPATAVARNVSSATTTASAASAPPTTPTDLTPPIESSTRCSAAKASSNTIRGLYARIAKPIIRQVYGPICKETFAVPEHVARCIQDEYIKVDLGQHWQADRTGVEGAMLNAIACDDAYTLYEIYQKHPIDLSAPIDVVRVRATTAPTYVRITDARETGPHGLAAVQHVLFGGTRHELPVALTPTPLVIAAVSQASNCVRLIGMIAKAQGDVDMLGSKTARVEHLIEAMLAVGDSALLLCRSDGALSGVALHPRVQRQVASFILTTEQTLKDVLALFPRSRPLPHDAVNPLSAVREWSVRSVLAGHYVEAIEDDISTMCAIFCAHGYNADEPVSGVPRVDALIRLQRYARAAKGDEIEKMPKRLAKMRTQATPPSEKEEVKQQLTYITSGRLSTLKGPSEETLYHSRPIDAVEHVLHCLLDAYKATNNEAETPGAAATVADASM